MKIKNLKVTKRGVALALAGTIVVTTTGCGNKQMLDFNKLFNVVVEHNNGYVSIVAISNYSDYTGDQVQFVTADGLKVLTGTDQTQLIKTDDANATYNYALMLAGNDEDKVIDYNAMQDISIDVSSNSWNKDILDLNYTYNKAIILSDGTATIVELNTWKDYEEDDKIQLKFKDETCLLTNMENVKLVNDDNAKENSLHNYAISLVGNEENIIYYDNSLSKVR